MEDLINWISNNKEWIFSGAGIAIIGLIGRFIYKGTQASSSQNIKSGKNSTNIQVGRDMNISNGSKNDNAGQK